jgi:hypothetical protein
MKKKVLATAVAAALYSAVPLWAAQSGAAPSPGQPAAAAPDAATQPGPVESTTREEFRADPFSLAAPAANPFGAVSSGIPFGIPAAETGAVGLRLGPGTLYPALGLNLRYDDNIFFTNANKKDSFISVVSPVVRYETRTPSGTYNLIAKGDFATYWDSHSDSYNDYQILGQGNWQFTGRTAAQVRLEHFRSHDPRGSTDRPVGTEPDVWRADSATGIFGYGTPGARGRIEVEGGYLSKRYENNRTVTRSADRDVAFGGGTFYWRVMPRTNLLFQVRDTDINYTLSGSTLDSNELRLLGGITWEATAKTTGIFKLGHVRKDFDSATRQDFSGIGWEASVRWNPLTYSTIQFTSAREPVESTGTGDFIISQIYYLLWTHAWSERVTSTVSTGYRTDDFRGGVTTRSDDTSTAGLRLTYRFRRNISFSGEYTFTDRSSNAPFVSYNRNVIMFSVGATL